MLTEVKKNIKLSFLCFKYNLLKAMDNRVSFISQILGMILNNGTMIIQWIVLFSLKDNIGGYGFKEVLLLWAFASTAYGVAHTFFNNAFNLSQLIFSGKLDAFLVHPKNTLVYLSASSSSVSAIGDILFGFIVLIILKESIIIFLIFTILSICGGLILASYSIIWHSLSFWFNNMDEFANIMNSNMVNLGTYPNGIFSKEIKWLLLTLIPVSFTVHIPVELITHFNLFLLLGTILFSFLLITFAFLLFNKGLKRYSSSNLMSARI